MTDRPFGETTEDAWKNALTGKWEPQRHDWQQAVLKRQREDYTPSGAKHGILMGGGTSSGKSSLTDLDLAQNRNQVVLDPDLYKMAIKNADPEVAAIKERQPQGCAARVHEESIYMTKQGLAQASDLGLDFIYDTTSSGNGGPKTVEALAAKGYTLDAKFAYIAISEAVVRANIRKNDVNDKMNFGRDVPEFDIYKSHFGAASNAMRYKDDQRLQTVEIWDNSGKPGESKLVMQRDAAGQTHVHDPEVWAKYQQLAENASTFFSKLDHEGPNGEPSEASRQAALRWAKEHGF